MKKLRPPLEYSRLIDLAATNKDPVVQELLWEIRRLHHILAQDLEATELIRLEWAKEVGDEFAAIHMMRMRLKSEPGAFEWRKKK
ncbi:hypothetical protein hmeg3_07685 [Herbaspirillum sp. meg3]|uniref:hypothetical protein n=1 Tax=Herbaspirillum sp. meg3 TaxID=2025949 RepID=UPI000B9976BA|nr:hypothetical protein [Herbaspirillum sp. meg3]ASU38190.1 hypothetical protein hmeg3_07685 [Herbaspirillum sp. meg3]